MNQFNLPEPSSRNFFYIFRSGQWIEAYKSEAEQSEFLVFVHRGNAWYLLGAYGSMGTAKGRITSWKSVSNRKGKAKTFIRALDGFVFEEVYFGKDYA